jgi:3',5'-cyclic AMP phosphodiesterase CpdA
MMNIVHISDTHGFHRKVKVPFGDVLIHSGDISNRGERYQVEDFIDWLVNQPHKYKIFIAGNHDICFDEHHPLNENKLEKHLMGKHYSPSKPAWLNNLLDNLPDNVFYLENDGCEIEGVKFWGSPVTPWFGGDFWVFNKHRGHDIKQVWEQIPMDTHVVITHGPVMYKCDYIPTNSSLLVVKTWNAKYKRLNLSFIYQDISTKVIVGPTMVTPNSLTVVS